MVCEQLVCVCVCVCAVVLESVEYAVAKLPRQRTEPGDQSELS